MTGLINTVWNTLLRFSPQRDETPLDIELAPAPPPPPRPRGEARALGERIDRAVRLGLRSYAERLVVNAIPFTREHPALAERVARVRLGQRRGDEALAVIDGCRESSTSLRLLRLVCLTLLGRRTEAHAELMHWTERSTAPLDARRLFALLEWQDGHRRPAVDALLANIRLLEDPASISALLLMALEEGRQDQARSWASRLRQLATTDRGVPKQLLLASLDLGSAQPEITPTAEQVRSLANELIAHEDVIPALVAAQTRELDASAARLQAAAIEAAMLELEAPGVAMEALARLALALDQPKVAARWIDRAKTLRPYAASLALLARDVDDVRRRHAAVTATASAMPQEKAA